MSDELWDLYADAVIDCEIDGGTRLLRGPNAGHLPGAGPVFVLTAYNPDGVPRDDACNASDERALEREIAATGVTFWPATGRSRDGSWYEPGVAVVGLDRDRVRELGARYGQLGVFELSAIEIRVVRCDDGTIVRTRDRGV